MQASDLEKSHSVNKRPINYSSIGKFRLTCQSISSTFKKKSCNLPCTKTCTHACILDSFI